LKNYNLNDALFLYGDYSKDFTDAVMKNKVFAIPEINDMPIEEWLSIVKSKIAGYLGFNDGLFYNMLVANAYAKQFNDAVMPLTKIQKKNIEQYFKDSEYAKILLNRNREIEIDACIDAHPTYNETPNILQTELSKKIPSGILVDSIVDRYKNKVVLVDFWATWCIPCLLSISEIKPLKDMIKEKDVVFVYITNNSSPSQIWQSKTRQIGGEHYYLNEKEWENIAFSEKYGFDGIPTYLIFDKKGELRYKSTAYPGNEKMQEILEKLLAEK
jgi:thiol-disulfide isomerase/thioredoxin